MRAYRLHLFVSRRFSELRATHFSDWGIRFQKQFFIVQHFKSRHVLNIPNTNWAAKNDGMLMLMNIRILVIIFSFKSITSNVIYLPFSLEKLVNRTVYFIALAHFHPRQVQKQQRNNTLIHSFISFLSFVGSVQTWSLLFSSKKGKSVITSFSCFV